MNAAQHHHHHRHPGTPGGPGASAFIAAGAATVNRDDVEPSPPRRATAALLQGHRVVSPLPMTPALGGATPRSSAGSLPRASFGSANSSGGVGSYDDTTPLYARFGLSQRSDVSSTFNSSANWASGEEGGDGELRNSSSSSSNNNNNNRRSSNFSSSDFDALWLASQPSPAASARSENGEGLEDYFGSSQTSSPPALSPRSPSNDPVFQLLRATKRRRVFLGPRTGRNGGTATTTAGDATQRPAQPEPYEFWTLCDDRPPMRLSFLDLLNANVANTAHRSITVGAPPSGLAREACHGHWACYFPVCELNHVWQGLVSRLHFSAFAPAVSVHVVRGMGLLNRIGGGGDDVGFDQILRNVQHGEVSEDAAHCCAVVPWPSAADPAEMRRAGAALMAALPPSVRKPVYFCPPSGERKEENGGSGGDCRRWKMSQKEHLRASTWRIVRELAATHSGGMDDVQRWNLVLYRLDGVVWKVVPESTDGRAHEELE